MSDLTAQEVQEVLIGVGLGQTAYGLNNAPGTITPGQPLLYQDDLAVMNQTGYQQLPLSLPAGFTVLKTYETTSGGNFFVATNDATKQIYIGAAGTNGIVADSLDRNSGLVYFGVNQVKDLFSQTTFRDDIAGKVGGDASWKIFEGGQSLGAPQVKYIGMALSYGLKDGDGQVLSSSVDGLSGGNFNITTQN